MHNFSNYPEHIYIHWPFCKNKCHYCDFISFQEHEQFINDYHLALCNQIFLFIKHLKRLSAKKIKTIYLGGGSPSLYPLDLLLKLFEIFKNNFDLSDLKEVTIEVNPAEVSEEKLRIWKSIGVNRLSAGVQYLDDEVLANLNRHQKVADVYNFFDIAPKYFKNISVDLILGLPGSSFDGWLENLNQVINWPINHLSIYLLMVYEKTPLFFKLKNKIFKNFEESLLINMYKQSIEFLQQNNFLQYEISNFAKPGFESIHNVAYWQRKPYIGFGLSAASFDGTARFVNEKNLNKYLNCLKSDVPNDLYCIKEDLSSNQVFLEKLMLGLRQVKGVDLHSVVYSLSSPYKEKFLQKLQSLKSEDLLQERGGKISLTVKGMLLENEVVLWLFDHS